MSYFNFEKTGKKLPALKEPIMIEGLPGIGNVGKIAVDFIVDKLKAEKMYEISSDSFPSSVFVNDKHLIDLPKIEIFYKKFKDKRNDLILITGDVQPIDEKSCFKFCEMLLDLAEMFDVKQIITTGGIGLNEVNEPPKVYITGNKKKAIQDFKKGTDLNSKIYGVVGPIAGVTGLLTGLSGRRDIGAISLLAETINHPMYLGMKPAKEMLKAMNKKLGLKLKLAQLEKEIKELEEEILKKTQELADSAEQGAPTKMSKQSSYIG